MLAVVTSLRGPQRRVSWRSRSRGIPAGQPDQHCHQGERDSVVISTSFWTVLMGYVHANTFTTLGADWGGGEVGA